MDDYLAEQPRARRILTIDGKDRGCPSVVGGDAGTASGSRDFGTGVRASGSRPSDYVPRIVIRRLSTTPLRSLSANVAV